MKKIGIKLADGSFYPLISEGEPDKTTIELTTANDGQTTVMVDLYRSETDSMEGAEFVDTLQLDSLNANPNGTNTLVLDLAIDENNELSATMSDKESGITSTSHTSLPELDKKNNDATTAALSTNFGDLADFDEEPVSAAVPTDDNAITESVSDKLEDFSLDDVPEFTEETEASDDATAAALSTDFGDLSDFNEEPADNKLEDFSFDDLPDFKEEAPTTENNEIDDMATTNIADDDIAAVETEDNAIIESVSDKLEDFSFDDLPDFSEEAQASDDATAAALSTDFGDLPDFSEEPATDDVTVKTDDIAESAIEKLEDLSFDDLPDFSEEAQASDDATAAALSTDFGDLPDFSEEPADNKLEDFSFDDLPDFNEEPATDDVTVETDDIAESAIKKEDNFSFDDLPDFNEEPEISDDATAAALSTDFGDLPDFSEEPASEKQDDLSLGDLPDFNEETASEKQDDFSLGDLPDFSDETTSTPSLDEENFSDLDIGNDINVNNMFAASTSLDDLNFADDLPDFNVSDSKKDDKFDLSDLPDFDTSDITGDDDFDLADLPNFSAITDTKKKDNLNFDDLPNFDDDSTTDSSSSFNFDGLYDQETIDGKSSFTDDTFEPEPKKKTKAPMIICIICAIICIIGTILVLFVVPSRFNLIPSRNTRNIAMQSQLPITPTGIGNVPATSTQQPLLSERVIVEQLPPEYENIIPSPPPPPSPKPQDIVYKVKRGDTLWDISSAYYRNPWRYKMIAQYNNIKNPDYIVSGQTLKLPAE